MREVKITLERGGKTITTDIDEEAFVDWSNSKEVIVNNIRQMYQDTLEKKISMPKEVWEGYKKSHKLAMEVIEIQNKKIVELLKREGN